jgi:hypothetical protein
MQLPDHKDLQTGTQAADGHPPPKQTSNDERRQQDLQMTACERVHPIEVRTA